MLYMNSAGKFIHKRRVKMKIRINVLAEKIGISTQFLNEVESGTIDPKNLRLDQIKCISRELDCPPEEIIGRIKYFRKRRKLEKSKTKTELGRFVQEKRIKLGYSLYKLSKLSGISYRILHSCERRKPKKETISQAILKSLAISLRCEEEELRKLLPKVAGNDLSDPGEINTFGKFIRHNRFILGISTMQLSRMLKLKPHQLYSVESGKSSGREIFKDLADELSNVLGCSKDEIETFLKPKLLISAKLNPKTDLGKFILESRQKARLSIRDLSERAGMPDYAINSLQSGRNKGTKLTEEAINSLSEALGCEAEKLEEKIGIYSSIGKFRERKKMPRTKLGKLLYEKRKNLRLTVSKVSKDLIKCKPQYYERIESGKVGNISSEMADKFSEVFGIKRKTLCRYVRPKKDSRLMPSESEFGKLIRKKRNEIGVSQQELADRMGFSRAYISLMEIGEADSQHRPETITKFTEALSIDEDSLRLLKDEVFADSFSKLIHDNSGKFYVGSIILLLRRSSFLTREELSKKTGISVGTLLKIEKNLVRPRVDKFLKILKQLNEELSDGIKSSIILANELSEMKYILSGIDDKNQVARINKVMDEILSKFSYLLKLVDGKTDNSKSLEN
jgi:transcriptional regulator with XRE-family HTH domain